MTDSHEPVGTDKGAAQTDARVVTFWERIRHLVASGFGSPNWLGSVRLWFGVLGAVVGAVILLWLVDKVVFYYLARNYVNEVAYVLDLNPHLANALILLTFVIAIFFARFLWSFSRQRRIVGISGLAGLLIAHSLVLWWATRDDILHKCYVISRDGNVTYREHPGIDPATGRECRPVTPAMVERLRKYQAGYRPQKVVSENPAFFDVVSGEPIVWYYRSKDNKIQLFDLMGFHPETGDELILINKEIADEWKDQNKPPPPPPRTPKRIDPNTFVFFDPLNGEPRAWYSRDAAGNFEFYDGPGFNPNNGEALLLATRDVVNEWKRVFACHENVPERVPQDYAQAVAWYHKAADQGNLDAQNNLGWMFESGWGIRRDYSQAIAWYRKAADQGNAHAQYNLGLMYEKGRGVPQDYTQAALWYRKAADQGLEVAQKHLDELNAKRQGRP